MQCREEKNETENIQRIYRECTEKSKREKLKMKHVQIQIQSVVGIKTEFVGIRKISLLIKCLYNPRFLILEGTDALFFHEFSNLHDILFMSFTGLLPQ